VSAAATVSATAATVSATAPTVESTSASTMEAASSSAMESTTAAAVEATSAMEPITAMKAARRTTSREAMASVAAAVATATVATATVTAATVAVTSATVTAPTPAVTTAAPAVPAAAPSVPTTTPAAIPRAGADEDSAGKPVRAVISVGRARVRIVAVVAVITNRGCSNVAWADVHAYGDLRLRVGQRNHQNRQQRRIL